MKKILFIGAGHFQIDGIIKAKQMGCLTIAVDGNPHAAGKYVADEFYVIDVTDKETIHRLAKEKNINGVLAVASEVSMETVGYITSKMKLKGYDYALIKVARDKRKYLDLFQVNGVAVPQTIVYDNHLDINNLLTGNKYFIKPSRGSGSRGVKQTSDIKSFDFDNYKEKYLLEGEELLIQEAIIGKELTVDGFILQGKLYVLAVSEEVTENQKGYTFSSELIFPPRWLRKNHMLRIYEVCNNVVNALKINGTGPIHLELMLTPTGDLYVIDFSLRGGGFDVFTKIIHKTSSVDVLKIYIQSCLGEYINIPAIKKYNPVTLSFIYPDNPGIIKKIYGKQLEGIYENYYLKFLYSEGEKIDLPESGKQRVCYFICWGSQHENVLRLRNELRERISLHVDYE